MKFDLVYTSLKKIEEFDCEIYEENYNYVNSYIGKIEDALYESQEVTFELNCLGEDWNVFIFYDFSLFTEHLLDIYKLIFKPNQSEYLMWYYEQDVDREIQFTKVDENTIKIENVSGEKWISPLEYETVTVEDLKKEIINFVTKIKDCVEIIYPELNSLEMLQKWYRSFGI